MNSPRRLARMREASARLTSQPSIESQGQRELQHRSTQPDAFEHTLPRRKARATPPPEFIPGFRYYPPASRIRTAS